MTNPKYLASLKRILRKYATNYKFHIAQSVNEGINLIQGKKIDLVPCDILMPEKDGFEMFKTLKADEKTISIPVVMLTGMLSSKLKLKALRTSDGTMSNNKFKAETA